MLDRSDCLRLFRRLPLEPEPKKYSWPDVRVRYLIGLSSTEIYSWTHRHLRKIVLADETVLNEDQVRVPLVGVTQLLRQGDAKVFKKYSQMKLQMKREALKKLNRKANEGQAGFDTERPN